MDATTTMPARPIAAEIPSTARLFIFPAHDAARWFALQADTTIHRAQPGVGAVANTIVLNDGRVSSTHANLQREPLTRAWTLTDAGSTNGTFVNGERTDSVVLNDGDVIRIGDAVMVFELGVRPHDDAMVSTAELKLRRDIARVAASESSVLMTGPTGAGKGFVARAIAQARADETPMVHINCAALPPTLIEAELFGHARGAFTGAGGAKAGLIETADGGTLFLDEIGTLPPELQAKLLVAIEEGRVRRVGETRDRAVAVRYLAATNVDVKGAIAAGTFREDLYYRLAAHAIEIPPLSARKADVLRLFCAHSGRDDHRGLTPETSESLLCWHWPGNVRELLNLAAATQDLHPEDTAIDFLLLPDEMTAFLNARASGAVPANEAPTPAPQSNAPPRDALVEGLAAHDNNVSALARSLGKHRNQVVRWLDAYGLRK